MALDRQAVEARADLSPEHFGTLVRLAIEADWRTGEVRGSVRALAEHLGYKRGTLRDHLDALDGAEEIKVRPRAGVVVLNYRELTGGSPPLEATNGRSAATDGRSAATSPGETRGEDVEDVVRTTNSSNRKDGSQEEVPPSPQESGPQEAWSPESWADALSSWRQTATRNITATWPEGATTEQAEQVAQNLREAFDAGRCNPRRDKVEEEWERVLEGAWSKEWDRVLPALEDALGPLGEALAERAAGPPPRHRTRRNAAGREIKSLDVEPLRPRGLALLRTSSSLADRQVRWRASLESCAACWRDSVGDADSGLCWTCSSRQDVDRERARRIAATRMADARQAIAQGIVLTAWEFPSGADPDAWEVDEETATDQTATETARKEAAD